MSTMVIHKIPRADDQAVIRALRASDLRLAEMYPQYCQLHADCTAAQLFRRMMRSGRYEWLTITQRQFTNLYNLMCRIVAETS